MLYTQFEDWQIVDGTEGMYVISDRGRVGKRVGDDEVEILIDIDDEGRANKKYKTYGYLVLSTIYIAL